MFVQDKLRTSLAILLVVAGCAYAFQAGYFGKELLAEIAIFAILAISLDFLAGFGGMVSLGHGAFFGAGAYVYAVATVNHGLNAGLAMIIASVLCGLAGWVVGAVTFKARGIFLIMATLAFGQMAYVYVFESRVLGGDDGMSGVPRLDLAMLGIDLNDPSVFSAALVIAAGLVYVVMAWLLASGFGHAITGLHRNEQRMRALGLAIMTYKAAAFAIAGAVAGFAGTLAAQHSMFVSPDFLHWTTSGLILVIVILGGLESLVGPALGAAVVIFLKHEISEHTEHWHFFIGLFLIIAVLAGGRGLYGLLEALRQRIAGIRSARRAVSGQTGQARRSGDA